MKYPVFFTTVALMAAFYLLLFLGSLVFGHGPL